MGRRALRKIDPSLDLTPYLLAASDLARPLDTERLFARPGPLEVEVGSGKGLFLASACQAALERNFLGIEVSRKYARFTAARLAKRQCRNALVVHGDATEVFERCLPADSVAAVHIYFPDPWWKKRHRRRRVMRRQLVADLQRTLVPGGVLHFWTDVEEYFHSTLQLLADSELSGPHEVPEHPAEHDLDYRTHFERRMRLQRQAVFRAQFFKL